MVIFTETRESGPTFALASFVKYCARMVAPAAPRALQNPQLLLLAVFTACTPEGGAPPSGAQKTESAIIISAQPSQEVTTTRELKIEFGQKMVAESEVNKTIENRALLEIKPKLNGTYRWTDTRTLVFLPKEQFSQATRYRVTVRRELLGPQAPPFEDHQFSFNTPMFTLISVKPFFEVKDKLNIRVNVELSHTVRQRDARAAIEFFDENNQPLTARPASDQDGRMIAFELDPLPVSFQDRKIKVRIKKGLAPLDGGEALAEDLTRELVITRAEALTVESANPGDQESAPHIRIAFSTAVELDNFQRALVIEPKITTRIDVDYRAFLIHGEFVAGEKYRIRVKKGLRSIDGALLAEDFEQEMVMADLAPSLRFSSRGAYLMRSGQKNLGLETVNVPRVQLRVGKVFDNNLVHMLSVIQLDPVQQQASPDEEYCYECEEEYDPNYSGRGGTTNFATFGRWLKSEELTVAAAKNELKKTPITFETIDVERRPGLYLLEVSDLAQPWLRASKWLIKTDLAITAKVGAAEVWTRVSSLATSDALEGVEVSLLGATNAVLDTARTDASGIAVFSRPPNEESPVLVAAKKNDDYSFLTFNETLLPSSDFDVGGEDGVNHPYSAFIYADRGIYRPGDIVQLTVLVRSRALEPPPEFPLVIEVLDPAMRVVQTLRGSTKNDGVEVFNIALPADATTGRYRFRAIASNEELGQLELLVEEFIPDRIKVEVTPSAVEVDASEPATFEVSAAYTFGAKAAGLKVDAACIFEEARLDAQPDAQTFAFAVLDPYEDAKVIVSRREELGRQALDADGNLSLSCNLKEAEHARGPVRARLLATVSENGGRAVTAQGSAVLHPSSYYVGARRTASTSFINEGEDAGLEVYVVDRASKPHPGVKLQGTISEVEWRTILKLVDQSYRYVSARTEQIVHTFELTSAPNPQKIAYRPKLPGLYRMRLVSEEGETSIIFYVGGTGENSWSMRRPDRIALSSDKATYQVGESANILVRSPYAGKLLVTLERDKVLWSKTYQLGGTTETISVPVIEAALPNMYLVAQLIRARDSQEKAAPERAFAVLPLRVDSRRHRLTVDLQAPKSMRPNGPLEVEIKVGGAEKRAQVTIAAVDEGVLQITRHRSPDPFDYFLKKRRLALATYDMYSLLLPELELAASGANEGGGGDRELRRKHYAQVSVKRVKVVALWSGLVTTGADGIAKVKLDVPDFNGTLRVMAVAFSGSKFGAAETDVLVKEPIILEPTLPRFLAPLDKIFMPLEVFNGTDKNTKIAVEVRTEGGAKILGAKSFDVELAAGGRTSLRFALQSDEVAGKAAVIVRGATKNISVEHRTELPIRPPNTTLTQSINATAKSGMPAKLRLPGGFIEGSFKARLNVGPSPTSQLGASLQYLLDYPHGCVEQTTSRAFPLLYLEDLAKSEGLKLDRGVDTYVAAGISRLWTMQLPDGGLSYWPGGSSGYPWTTAYAAHFLVEASRAGFTVEPHNLEKLMVHLESIARGSHPRYSTIDDTSRMYALYVLALAKRAPQHEMLQAIRQMNSFTVEPRALLGAALILAGERTRGESLLDVKVDGAGSAEPFDDSGDGFRSTTRETAIVLSLWADLAPKHPQVSSMYDALMTKANDGIWRNTQENAYALMALGKINKRLGVGAAGKAQFLLDGKLVATFDPKKPITFESKGNEWIARDLEVVVEGPGGLWIGATVEGIKASIPPPASAGITVTRELLDRDGSAINFDSLKQGDLVVIRDTIANNSSQLLQHVAVVDLLPAGLEIENPRLMSSAAELEWLNNVSAPEYLDVRDDRAIFYTNLGSGETRYFYYAARAVTEGSFTLPHLHAEAMYEPAIHGRDGAGRVEIGPRAQ